MIAKKRKKILIVGARAEQTLAILEAKKLGLTVIACDENPKAEGLKYADVTLKINLRDEKALRKIALQYKVNGIFAHALEIPHILSRVAQSLNLPSVNPRAAECATNKYLRISKLTASNIPCPRFDHADSFSDLSRKAKRFGFPFVLKPIDSAAARGVQLVQTEKGLKTAYHAALSHSRAKKVLLEELLEGAQISTESIIYKGHIHTFAFADRNYNQLDFFLPYFIEDGINFPSTLPKKLQTATITLVEKAIRALNIDFGSAKGDIIVDKDQPKILELAARTSGGWFGAGSITFATGINMLKPLLQMHTGDKPDLEALKPKQWLGCAQRYLIPKQRGRLTRISGIKKAIESPGVVHSFFSLPKAGTLIKKATNHTDRLGELICTGKNRNEAITLCEEAMAKIKFHFQQKR